VVCFVALMTVNTQDYSKSRLGKVGGSEWSVRYSAFLPVEYSSNFFLAPMMSILRFPSLIFSMASSFLNRA